MREIVIHLGGNKTGSTALQNALFDSRKELSDSGVSYPDFSDIGPTGSKQHWPFALGFQRHPERYFVIKQWKYSSDETKVLIDKARERVKLTALERPKTVLSAEAFANLEVRELKELRAWISQEFSRIKAVYYARPPGFGKFYSMFQQFVKSGHAPTATETVRHKVFDQMNQAKKIQDAFPFRSMRVYEKEGLRNADIVSDFCFASGIPALKHYTVAHHVNRSLSRGAIALIHKFNRYAEENDDGLDNFRQEVIRLDRTGRVPFVRSGGIPRGWDADLVLREIDDWYDYLLEAGEVARAEALRMRRPVLEEEALESELFSRPEAFQCWLDSHLPEWDTIATCFSQKARQFASETLPKL